MIDSCLNNKVLYCHSNLDRCMSTKYYFVFLLSSYWKGLYLLHCFKQNNSASIISISCECAMVETMKLSLYSTGLNNYFWNVFTFELANIHTTVSQRGEKLECLNTSSEVSIWPVTKYSNKIFFSREVN